MARGFVWWVASPLVNGVLPKREQAQSFTSISSGLDLRRAPITRRRWPSFELLYWLRIARSCGGKAALDRDAFRAASVFTTQHMQMNLK